MHQHLLRNILMCVAPILLLTFSRPGPLLKHFLGQITFVDKPVRRQPRDDIFPLLAYNMV
jgi:hypothetical protein